MSEEKTNATALGAFLREIRDRSGLLQRELVAKAAERGHKISIATARNCEGSIKRPKPKIATIHALYFEACQITPDEMLKLAILYIIEKCPDLDPQSLVPTPALVSTVVAETADGIDEIRTALADKAPAERQILAQFLISIANSPDGLPLAKAWISRR